MPIKTADYILADLLSVVEQAIESGDWKVDGACDPDASIQRSIHCLEGLGFHRNGISGEWQRGV